MNKIFKNTFFMSFAFIIIMSLFVCKTSISSEIDLSKRGSLTIYCFEVSNLEDYYTPGSGEENNNINSETTKPLLGVQYALYKVDGIESIQSTPLIDAINYIPLNSPIETKTTDSNGVVSFTNLELGRYYVKIINVPENVNQESSPFFVDIPMTNSDGTDWNYDIKVYPKNQTIYGSVILKKVDQFTNEALHGAEFELHQTELNGKEINDLTRLTNLTTNYRGQILIYNLPPGKYYFKEIKAPEGYSFDNEIKYEFEITNSGSIKVDSNDVIISKDNTVPELVVKNLKINSNTQNSSENIENNSNNGNNTNNTKKSKSIIVLPTTGDIVIPVISIIIIIVIILNICIIIISIKKKKGDN